MPSHPEVDPGIGRSALSPQLLEMRSSPDVGAMAGAASMPELSANTDLSLEYRRLLGGCDD
jgi:hypothetical protein